MIRIFSLVIAILILIVGCIVLVGYNTVPEYSNSIEFDVQYSLELTWQELLKIEKIPERKRDVASVEVLEQFGKLVAWQENLKNGGYRIYRMNKREENKNLVLELTDSSYGLTGIWSFELYPHSTHTTIILSEESQLNNLMKRGYRTIMGREHDLLVWQKYIKVGLVQALLLTP